MSVARKSRKEDLFSSLMLSYKKEPALMIINYKKVSASDLSIAEKSFCRPTLIC